MKHSIIKEVILATLFCILSSNAYALRPQNSGRKIEKKQSIALNKADISYHNFNFSVAADYYETYLQSSSKSPTKVLAKLADCYWQMRAYGHALRVYLLMYPSGIQGANMQDQHRIAELYARYGQYQQAFVWLKGVTGYNLKARIYNEADSITAMKKDSLNWKLGFLNLNTPYREFSPFIVNNSLFFSSNKPFDIQTKAFGWDGDNFAHLWVIPLSKVYAKSMNDFSDSTIYKKCPKEKTKKLAEIYECGDDKPMNKAYGLFINNPDLKANSNTIGSVVRGLNKISFNAGTISMDKNNHIYFSSNYTKTDRKGVNRIRLMEGVYSNDKVTKIRKLPFGDPKSFSVMHPAINMDGTLLICSSDKTDGQGGYDLYYSQRTAANNTWDPLKPFGKNVNTIGNEVFPSLTPNGYLYYSSDQAPGLGGLDIFRIPLKDAIAGKGVPEHLSYPVNSSADDFGWTQMDSAGTKGFFTSDRFNSDDNLYSYSDELALRAPRKSFIEGYVLEKQSKNPIKGATVLLYNLKEDSVYVAKSDINGKYHIPVLNSSDVIIKAIDKKHFNDCLSSSIFYTPQPKDTIQKAPRDLLLDEFKIGFVWTLRNTHYDFDKWNVRKDAVPILDSLVTILNEQPINVELGSHTDSRGSFEYNDRLSQQRSVSTVDYLVKHGIDPKRITSKSYGKHQLLNQCEDGVPCTEAAHQANRRTEVKVTGYTVPKMAPESIDPDLFKDGAKITRNLLPPEFFDHPVLTLKNP